MNHDLMVGFRWVGCCVLLALACGRTANNHETAASAGAPPAVGGSGSGGARASGGTGVSEQAGEAGAPDCPVTPVEGQWVGIGPDPYGFKLSSDGSHVSGDGCLGGLPSEGEPVFCSPLSILADRGRRFAFVWDMKQSKDAIPFGYVVKMELTLSPDRTAMAGKVWASFGGPLDEDGQDIVLVRAAAQPVPPATTCSGGEPSGACFLGPLGSDRVREPSVVELGGGDLLLLWLNQRGDGNRLATARFDAKTGAWQDAEFLDDGSAPVDLAVVTASPQGSTMVVYRQGLVLVARAYNPKTKAWSDQQVVVVNDDVASSRRPEALLVYDNGDATLITSSDGPNASVALSAHEYAAKNERWKAPHVIIASVDIGTYQWAAGSNAIGNALLVWVRGGAVSEPYDLAFSSRSAAGSWSDAQMFYTGDHQIVNPAVAVDDNGTAIVTWQDFLKGISSNSYSFDSGLWSEPLTVTTEPYADNGAVAFNAAGLPVAYFHSNNAPTGIEEEMTVLADGVWGVPVMIPQAEANGAEYSVERNVSDLQVTPLHPRPGESAPPPLTRPRCEGY